VSVLPFVALSVVPLLLSRQPILSAEHAILAMVVLPAGFGYAILRYKILQVQLLQRWLVRIVIYVFVAGALALAAVGICHQLGAMPRSESSLAALAVILALVASSAVPRIVSSLQSTVDRALFRDSYDYRASLGELSRWLSIAAGLDGFVDTLPATLQHLMNLEFVLLLVTDEKGLHPLGTAGTAPSGLTEAAMSLMPSVEAPHKLFPLAIGDAVVMLAPLQTQDTNVGCLCLGPKRSGEPFRPDDESLLLTLSGHLAATILSAQLAGELRTKVHTLDALYARLQRAQEEERARLGSELHDEPLQLLLLLRRQLAAGGDRRATDAEQLALCDDIIGRLRAVCQEARPNMLDELGLAAALEALTADLGRHTEVAIVLDADPAVEELPISQLVLYRAAQEALNNALKHARATTLRITLCPADGGVRLCVSDDGQGFVPASPSALVASGHFGLSGIKQRVTGMGGCLDVRSGIGQGTEVCAWVPALGDSE
jgi:signal transduction histidine kinase